MIGLAGVEKLIGGADGIGVVGYRNSFELPYILVLIDVDDPRVLEQYTLVRGLLRVL